MNIDVFMKNVPRHGARVAEGARILAQYMGMMPETIERLAIAGAVHDIGKYGLPKDILTKPSCLEASEWDVLRTHATRGADVLSGQVHPYIVEAVRFQRERWDGTGYPNELEGRDIPLISRTLAVVDAYEAMIHERPYRPAFTELEACTEMKRKAGEQFDPVIVDRMVELVAQRRIAA